MKILFIYNADSGKMNAMLDIAHKIISPSTYNCSLCALTHSALTEKDEWRSYKDTAKNELSFLHKDEFEKIYTQRFDYPVILDISGKPRVLLDADEINAMASVKDLINALETIS